MLLKINNKRALQVFGNYSRMMDITYHQILDYLVDELDDQREAKMAAFE